MVNFGLIESAWAQSKPAMGRIQPEPGFYKCSIYTCIPSVVDTKKGEMARVQWVFTVKEGDLEGGQIERTDWLDGEKACSRLKGTMKILGLEIPDNPNDLDLALYKAQGMDVLIEVKKAADYTNIYIRKVLATQVKADPDDLTVFDAPSSFDNPDIQESPVDEYLY